jgi:hypothetical protein
MLFRPGHGRFLLRRTPTPEPIRRVQSVVTLPPPRPVGPNIGDGKLMSRRVEAAGIASCMAALRIRHCVAERSNGDRDTSVTSLEGGRDASKLWRQRDSAMKTGRCSGLKGIAAAPWRWSAQLCARRRPCTAGSTFGEVKMITSNSQSSRSIRRQTALHIHSAICCNTYNHDLLAASSVTSRTMPAGKRHSTNTDHR